jgi:uncharacterized protein YraI
MRDTRRRFLRLAGAGTAGLALAGAGTAGLALAGVGAPGAAAARTYSIDFDLTTRSGLSGAALDEAIRQTSPGSPLVGLGDTFVAVEREHDVNAVYQAAHAAWESAWGRSTIAREKNNLYGWRAYDSCPGSCAREFASKADCVRYVVPRIDDLYLTPGGTYYTDAGPTLRGMNRNYATDPNWASGIAGVMDSLGEHLPDRGRDPTFASGDRVETTADLSVRTGAGTGYERTWVAPDGSAGYVRDGPRRADGYTWWRVGFNAGHEGWVVEAYLAAAPTDGTFETGERVATTTDLSVRAAPGTGEDRVAVADAGAAGYVRGGPRRADGYTWWEVEYNAGDAGWSVESSLEAAPLDS